jgi:hypothetical protein
MLIRREEPAAPPDTTAREVQRVLESAHRVVEEIERNAAAEGARVIAEAQAHAADVLAAAHRQTEDVLEEARREVTRLEARAAALHAHCLQLRSIFESAADTAGTALSEIAAASVAAESTVSDTV